MRLKRSVFSLIWQCNPSTPPSGVHFNVAELGVWLDRIQSARNKMECWEIGGVGCRVNQTGVLLTFPIPYYSLTQSLLNWVLSRQLQWHLVQSSKTQSVWMSWAPGWPVVTVVPSCLDSPPLANMNISPCSNLVVEMTHWIITPINDHVVTT